MSESGLVLAKLNSPLPGRLRATGATLVNMAHTIYFPNVDFSMCDVDWLFVFGQRSQLWWDLPLRESFDLLRYIYRVPAGRHRQRFPPPRAPWW